MQSTIPKAASIDLPLESKGTLASVSTFFAEQVQRHAHAAGSKPPSAAVPLSTEILWLPGLKLPERAKALCHWQIPAHHFWPTRSRSEGFVEKAAQGLFRKFGESFPLANILCFGATDSLKSLSSNLRGRLLQVFQEKLPSGLSAYSGVCTLAPQDGLALWVFVAESGLWAGVCSPREAGSFWPGGRRFVQARGPSRAGGKWVEFAEMSLLHLGLKPQGVWLELGSAPGGVTSEMIEDGLKVVAVDRAAMDPRVLKSGSVRFLQQDCSRLGLQECVSHAKALGSCSQLAKFEKPRQLGATSQGGAAFDGIFCDMNADPQVALESLVRVLPLLDGPFGITLKLVDPLDAFEHVETFEKALVRQGVESLTCRHLWHNRSELTILGKKVLV